MSLSTLRTQPLPLSFHPSLTNEYQPFEIDSIYGGKKTVYSRRLHGFEQLVGLMSESATGFSQMTASLAFTFSDPCPSTTLFPAAKRAWIRLRHLVPALASRTFGMPKEEQPDTDDEEAVRHKGHYMMYETPQSKEEVLSWADETIKNYETEEGWVLDKFHSNLTGEFWKPAEGKFNTRLNIGNAKPGGNGEWLFAIHAGHYSIDGRGGLMVLDQFLHFLIEDLKSQNQDEGYIENFAWGDETVRLAAAAAVFFEKEGGATGSAPEPPKAENGDAKPAEGEKAPEGESASPPVPFMRPFSLINPDHPKEGYPPIRPDTLFPTPVHKPVFQNSSHLITLSRPLTKAFQHACKSRGLKHTAVMDTCLVLGEVEVTMRTLAEKKLRGEDDGEKKWKEIKQLYDTAGMFLVPLKFIDMRPTLPSHVAAFTSPKTTPLACFTSAPHVHSMPNIRKAVLVSDDGDVTRDSSQDAFWDGAVGETVELWAKEGRPTPQNFVIAQNGLTMGLPEAYDFNQMQISGILHSSLGDIDRMGQTGLLKEGEEEELGLFGRWNPAVSGEISSSEGIDGRIQNVLVSARNHGFPHLVAESFLYNGQLNLFCFGTSAMYTDEEIQRWSESVIGWVKEAVGKEGMERVKSEEEALLIKERQKGLVKVDGAALAASERVVPPPQPSGVIPPEFQEAKSMSATQSAGIFDQLRSLFQCADGRANDKNEEKTPTTTT